MRLARARELLDAAASNIETDEQAAANPPNTNAPVHPSPAAAAVWLSSKHSSGIATRITDHQRQPPLGSIRHDQNRGLANSSCRASLPLLPDRPRRRSSNRAVPPPTPPNHHRVRPIARPSIQPAPPYWSPNRSCQTPSTSPTQAYCCGQIAVTLTRNSLARLPQVRSSEASGRRPPARGCSIARRPPKPFTMSATGSLITASESRRSFIAIWLNLDAPYTRGTLRFSTVINTEPSQAERLSWGGGRTAFLVA
jgi:hypothetical protein